MPLYVPPALRSSREPNPFDRSASRRPLKIFVDWPLKSGPIDGENEFHGYPFIGGGSTGYPDSAAVLRSHFGHSAFEFLFPACELAVPDGVEPGEGGSFSHHDAPSIPVKVGSRVRDVYIDSCREVIREASGIATKYQIDELDSIAGMLLHRLGQELEADLAITDREWLLEERPLKGNSRFVNVFSPDDALALMGLYLRWHGEPIVIGGTLKRWPSVAVRRSAAFVSMPAFERLNQAGRKWYDTAADPTLESLNQTFPTRMSRSFKFRDGVCGLSATMVGGEPEEMLCELDSLPFLWLAPLCCSANCGSRPLFE